MHYSAKRGLAIKSSVCPSVCPSVTLMDHDHIGWKYWKLIAQTISPTSSLFVAQKSSAYSQANMEKFWVENVHSTPMSIMSSWIESCFWANVWNVTKNLFIYLHPLFWEITHRSDQLADFRNWWLELFWYPNWNFSQAQLCNMCILYRLLASLQLMYDNNWQQQRHQQWPFVQDYLGEPFYWSRKQWVVLASASHMQICTSPHT